MKIESLLSRTLRGWLMWIVCGYGVSTFAATLTVNATTDTGAGSGTSGDLRYCVVHSNSGDTITFASTLSAATITLSSEIVFSNSVTIDGSNLASSIILSGNSAHRIFTVNSGSSVTLNVLSLTAGNGTGASSSGNGGAILNNGTLTPFGSSFAVDAVTAGNVVSGLITDARGALHRGQ